MRTIVTNNMMTTFTKNWKLSFLPVVVCILIGCSEDTIDFEETGTLTGTVISALSQEPIANTEVSTNPSSSTVFTNENGDFIINDILVDSYAVQAEATGFVVGFESVTITADNISNVAFQLEVGSQDNIPPSSPQLLAPDDGADNIDIQVQLAWSSFDPEGEELNYTIELRNGSTSEIESFEVVADTTLTVSSLDLSTTYFWQVAVEDDVNEPVVSTIRQFTTLEFPLNPILFTRDINDNSVIFSGDQTDGSVDVNILQLTDTSFNSFNPHKNLDINKIAFLRTVAGETQLFSMDFAGEDIQQLTTTIPVSGFRNDALDFTWHNNGAQLLYPNFDRLISVNNDGSGTDIVYTTPDNALISEVASLNVDTDLVVIKTNNLVGFNVRIVLVRLSTGLEEAVILEGEIGAGGGIDITSSGNDILYFRDLAGDENNEQFRIFQARPFIYNVPTDTTIALETGANLGENVLDTSFLPTEAGIIFTRVANDVGAIPDVYVRSFDSDIMNDRLLFTAASMPDLE